MCTRTQSDRRRRGGNRRREQRGDRGGQKKPAPKDFAMLIICWQVPALPADCGSPLGVVAYRQGSSKRESWTVGAANGRITRGQELLGTDPHLSCRRHTRWAQWCRVTGIHTFTSNSVPEKSRHECTQRASLLKVPVNSATTQGKGGATPKSTPASTMERLCPKDHGFRQPKKGGGGGG